MNINSLLEMTQNVSANNNLTQTLVSKKTSSKDFTGMFDNMLNVNGQKDLEFNYESQKTEIKTNENNFETKMDKTEKVEMNDVNKTKDIEDDNTVDFTKIEKDENEDDVTEATCEVFAAILNMFNDNTLDMSEYFNVNEDGTYEVNLENISDLKIEIQNYFDENNIDIDLSILDQDENYNFENLLDTTLNFICDEANSQVRFENVFIKDTKIIDIKDFDKNKLDDKNILFNANEKEMLTINPEDLKEVVSDVLNTEEVTLDENQNDNFEILKNTINEMIDSVEVVTNDSNEIDFEKQINIDETSSDDEIITSDENETVVSETSLSSDEVVNETSEDEEFNLDEKNEDEDMKTSKKDHKHKNIEIKNQEVKNEFTFEDVNDNEIDFNKFEYKDLVKENNVANSITDKYIETVNVAKQMVKGMELKLSEGSQEMNIKLDPENLGKVNLKIVTENGLVTAKFEAENQKVKEIIESNLSLLKESLEKRGVEVQSLDVSVNQNMNNQTSQQSLDYMRQIAQGKNPHKILGKSIKNFISTSDIRDNEIKNRGLFMTKSKVNYIA